MVFFSVRGVLPAFSMVAGHWCARIVVIFIKDRGDWGGGVSLATSLLSYFLSTTVNDV